MLNENSFMYKVNEAFRSLQRGNVKKLSSITISFPVNDNAEALNEPIFTANGDYDNDFTYTSVKLNTTPEMKSMANSLREKANAQLEGQVSIWKDKLREVLLRAATEV